MTTRIMQVFAIALALDEESFVPLIDQPISALRAPNYAGPNSPRLR